MSPALSPSDLAQRIAALDWSGTSLQHQLAVTAAVETLRHATVAEVERAAAVVVPSDSDLSNAHGPGGVIVTARPCNVVVLPVRQRTCWTTICHMDGRPWSTSSHFGPGGAWNWIVESVAHEHSVPEDQVGCIESDAEGPYNGDDLVTIDGLPVYRIQHVSR